MKSAQIAGPSGARPLGSRVCESVVHVFALWTVCCHLVVALGGNLRWLMLTFGLAGVGVGFAWWRVCGGSQAHATESSGILSSSPPAPDVEPRTALFVGAALGLAAASAGAITGNPVVLWCTGMAALGFGAIVVLRDSPHREAPREGPRLELALFGIALLCAIYTLAAHRPDGDDAFYVNVAVAAIDRMDLPLLSAETLHGLDNLPMYLPAYRLHSFELGNAALSLLTGIPPIYAFHWISAACAALLLPLAHAELFRRLAPKTWLPAVAILVLLLVCVGETHRWYGNFAFVRMWQGKSISLFVFLPLVFSYAMAWAERPSAAGLLRLTSVQIAALGASINAVWGAPLAVGLGLLAATPTNFAGLRRLLPGLATTLYVVTAGLMLGGGVSADASGPEGTHAPGAQLGTALELVLGVGSLRVACLVCVFVAWTVCPCGIARRLAVLVPLVVFAVLLNPWTDALVRGHVVGPWYWRSLWALPVPLLVTLVLVAPLRLEGSARKRWTGRALTLLGVGILTLALPATAGFSQRNGVKLQWPTAKVNEEAYRWARALNKQAPGLRVAAPPEISTWVPTFRGHAYPLMVRFYLSTLGERLGATEILDRSVMSHFVGGELRDPDAAAIFARGLELYDVSAVCLRNSGHSDSARQILRKAGYARRVQSLSHEIWVRE